MQRLNLNAGQTPASDRNGQSVSNSEAEALITERIELRNRMLAGANWFFWIAGLSIINSIISSMRGSWNFIVGLGLTQVIDAVAYTAFPEAGTAVVGIALVLDILVACIFIFLGLLARQQQNWAFITGMIFYALDGLIFVVVQDWLATGFHVFALYCIYAGWRANNQLERLQSTVAN